MIAEQQDEELELVSGSIGVLKNMSQRIGNELDEQAVWVSAGFGYLIVGGKLFSFSINCTQQMPPL